MLLTFRFSYGLVNLQELQGMLYNMEKSELIIKHGGRDLGGNFFLILLIFTCKEITFYS